MDRRRSVLLSENDVSLDQTAQVSVPIVDLLARPNGPRDRQLLLGAEVSVHQRAEGFAYIQSKADGYVGYVDEAALAEYVAPDRSVITRATHAYSEADLKSPETCRLSFGAAVHAIGTSNEFTETAHGFIPSLHLAPQDEVEPNLAAIARLFLGTPYLWGGNSTDGIDCSGLVQAILRRAGQDCPGDSDMQEAELGRTLTETTRLTLGDLLFWKGHVAMVLNDKTLIHANGYHMAVVEEAIDTAIARIENSGGGPVTRRARL